MPRFVLHTHALADGKSTHRYYGYDSEQQARADGEQLTTQFDADPRHQGFVQFTVDVGPLEQPPFIVDLGQFEPPPSTTTG